MSPKAFALLLSLTASAVAQTYTTKKIVFKHPGPFTQAQLESASGLHAGMKVTGDDVGAAAQKLADSQYFDNVQAAMADSGGLVVTFDLTPSPAAKFLPTGFENFVWLTPAEIDAALHAKLPLYNGTMAEGSAAVADASAALQDALLTKGIHAHVTCDSVEPNLLHPTRVLEFRVQDPAPRIANIKLDGVSSDLVPLLQISVNKTANTLYNAGLNGLLTADRILEPIRDGGYAKATLESQTVEVQPVTSGSTPVIVHATLHTGSMYKVSAITFAGTPLFSADDFARTTKLKPGDIASQKLLLETLAPLNDAYLSKGFLDVVIQSDPKYDEAARTVAYNITVEPGEPYKLHDITPQGLDNAAVAADFKRGFLLKPGDVYNPIYVKTFIKQNTALQAFQGYTGLYKATAFPATHTVDLTLVFSSSTVNVH